MKRTIITLLSLLAVFVTLSARQPQRGYRGFLDWSNSLHVEHYTADQSIWNRDGSITEFYTGFSTSHGYQFNPNFFLGAGLDYEHCNKISSDILALYLQGRTDITFGRFTPFGDIRLGYNCVVNGGVYFSPTVGYRFSWSRKLGLNLGVGLTLVGYGYDQYEIVEDPSGYKELHKTGTIHRSIGFFSFRIGIDF